MADDKLVDEEELIPVDTPPVKEEAEKPGDDVGADDDAEDDDDEADDEGGDKRLAESEDDAEEDVATQSTNAARRKKRRELRKRAKDNAERELAFLRQQNDELIRRVSAVEGHALSSNSATLDQQLRQTQAEIQQAEMIIAKAIEAGNGEDVATALRLRDEAKDRAFQLTQAKQRVDGVREQAQRPQVDPRVKSYASEWLAANPWYDPNGRDEDSRITKAIDDGLAKDGFNPSTHEYWQELTRRVSARIGEPEPRSSTPRRKAPPTGNSREHVPVSTKREVYVTPERKQAMMDAGVWDDPVARTKMLKAYQAYDKSSAR